MEAHTVPTDRHLELHLQIDPQADPITGRLSDAGHRSRAFRGWLGLAAAIEELIRPEAGTPPTTITPED